MRRVLHVINGDIFAGAERVQDHLAMNLPEFGYHVGFAGLKAGQFATECCATDAPLQTFEMSGKLDFSVARRIADFALSHNYTILHAHTPRSAMIASLAGHYCKLPFLYHVHGPTLLDTEHFLKNHINSLVERVSVRKAQLAISVSSYAASYARRIGIPEAKLRTVWNGVPVVEQRPVDKDDDVFRIGTVALFRPRKGIEVLIEALALLPDTARRRFRLHMIGSFETASYEEQIRDQARALGVAQNIEWVGYSDDVYGELQKLSAFVLPSLYGEGFPMVVLEAMASGVPVLATRVGGISEAITDMTDGLLVEPADANAMATGILRLIDEPALRKGLADNARQKQVEKYSDRAMAAGVAAVYDEVHHKTGPADLS